MLSGLLSLLGWAFLPELVTGYVQSILYAVIIRAGDPKPAPGSKRWVQDRRRTRIAVIIIYLLYTIVDADYVLRGQGDFYQLLGVSHGVDEKGLQSRFRRLTVQYHPDKVTGADRDIIEGIYVQLKLARDTLIDPAKRFAYDRFGPDILQWRQCKALRDYIIQGIQQTTAYYVVTGAVLVLIGTLGYAQRGTFWRYLTLFGMFLVELHTVTRPTYPAVLSQAINPFLLSTGFRTPYLPFQFLALLRKVSITLFIAFSQLGPLLEDPSAQIDGDAVSQKQLDQIDAMSKIADVELARLMGLELTPFGTQPATLTALRSSLKEWLVQNTVRNDQEVGEAVKRVLDKRRAQNSDLLARS